MGARTGRHQVVRRPLADRRPGYSLSQTSAIIGAVALVILVAAAFSGKLADRFGRVRIIRIALWIYGIGLLTRS